MKKITLFMAMLTWCVMLAAAAQKKVAVYVEGNIGNDEKTAVSSAILSRMSGSKEFSPFERNSVFINSLDKEQDFQTSGDVPEGEIRKIGERMGVDYVIVAHVFISDDDKCIMSARLINLVTGNIEKSVDSTRDYTDRGLLTSMAKTLTYRLINKKSK